MDEYSRSIDNSLEMGNAKLMLKLGVVVAGVKEQVGRRQREENACVALVEETTNVLTTTVESVKESFGRLEAKVEGHALEEVELGSDLPSKTKKYQAKSVKKKKVALVPQMVAPSELPPQNKAGLAPRDTNVEISQAGVKPRRSGRLSIAPSIPL